MAMIENRMAERPVASPCPDWLAAVPAVALRRAVVLGCALCWVLVIGIAIT